MTTNQNKWDKDHKTHYWKIRREGYRDFYTSKGWRGVGYGCVKYVGGRKRVMWLKEEHDDYYLMGFSLRYLEE